MTRYRRSPGASIEHAGLPDATVHHLRAHGIGTCAQLHDLLERCCEAQAQQVFGLSLTEARLRIGQQVRQRLPQDVRAALAQSSFTLPPLTGIQGPASTSTLLMARRAQRQIERKKVVTALREIRDLPTRMLLTNWMTPVGDQGHLGSCTGWGSTANRELLAQKRLASLFAYAIAKYLDGRPDVEGSWQYFCFEGFASIGHLCEADYPYTDRPAGLPVEPYIAQAAAFRSNGFADVLLDPEDMELQPLLLKAILAGRLNDALGPQPVSTSLAIYESWDSASTALYGLVTLPLDGERLRGGHALCIAGYIDATDPDGLYGIDYFVLKNSWGTRWAADNPLGLPGYALVPAAYFTRPSLHWEALVCLAEPSPVRSRVAGWLDLLRVAWDSHLLTQPVAVGRP